MGELCRAVTRWRGDRSGHRFELVLFLLLLFPPSSPLPSSALLFAHRSGAAATPGDEVPRAGDDGSGEEGMNESQENGRKREVGGGATG